MDMIAMLAGLGGPTDMWQSNSGGGYTPSLNKTSGGSSGSSYGSTYLRNTGVGKSGASVAGQDLDQYLAGKGLAQDLPALPKPSKPVADPPYIAGQTKQAFLERISLAGGIPTAQSLIQSARDKVGQWARSGVTSEQQRRRIRLLEALLRGRAVFEGDFRANAFTVQMAREEIIALTKDETFFDEVVEKASKQAEKDFGFFGSMKGVAKIVFDAAKTDEDAVVLLRSFAAQAYAPQPLAYPNLAGLDAAGWPALFDSIKSNPDAVIIGAAYRFVLTEYTKINRYRKTAFATQIPLAIAEGLVIRDYKAKADQVAAWNEAKARYDVRNRRYVQNLAAWQAREDYRARRIKATEDYYAAVSAAATDKAAKDAAAAKTREEKARKEAEDARAAQRTAEASSAGLQQKVDELTSKVAEMQNASASGDTASAAEAKAAVDALNATIAQLKQEVVDAQNAAVEAARNANQSAGGGGGGGGGGFVTTDTSQAAADATQAATDATQIAVDALQQTGETVTFKPPAEKKGGSGMLLVLGAVAVGGYFWWRSRRPARPSLMP